MSSLENDLQEMGDAAYRIERAREATAISKAQRLQANKDVLLGVLGKLELPLRMLAQGGEIQGPRMGAGYLLLEDGVSRDGRSTVLDHLQQLARVKPSGRPQSLDTTQALLYLHDTDSLCLLFVRPWAVRLFRGRESTPGDVFIWLCLFLGVVVIEPALGLVLMMSGVLLLLRKSLLRLVARWQPMWLYQSIQVAAAVDTPELLPSNVSPNILVQAMKAGIRIVNKGLHAIGLPAMPGLPSSLDSLWLADRLPRGAVSFWSGTLS